MALEIKVEGTFGTWKDQMVTGRMPQENLKYLLPDIPYLAGLIDGEGSICIAINSKKNRARKRCKNPTFTLRLTITNNSEWLLNRVKARFGGTVVPKNRHTPDKRTGKIYAGFDVIWQNFRAGWILWNIYPHLILKREQAKVAFQFLHNLRKTNRQELSKADVEIRKALRQRLQALNGSQRSD